MAKKEELISNFQLLQRTGLAKCEACGKLATKWMLPTLFTESINYKCVHCGITELLDNFIEKEKIKSWIIMLDSPDFDDNDAGMVRDEMKESLETKSEGSETLANANPTEDLIR